MHCSRVVMVKVMMMVIVVHQAQYASKTWSQIVHHEFARRRVCRTTVMV